MTNSNSKDQGGPLRVAFIGAGGVNFGSSEGPWNHSSCLERILGKQLIVSAVVDPFPAARERVLAAKRATPSATTAGAYKLTRQYANIHEFIADVAPAPSPVSESGTGASTPIDLGEIDEGFAPHMILIGIPPAHHGGSREGVDMEITLAKAFPDAALFVEKPLSSSPVEEVRSVAQHLTDHVVSVGYFMRYLRAVQKMKQIIRENNLTVMATQARYASCYPSIQKRDWWMKSISCTPIVEQGTHFADLSRYFGGDVIVNSVAAHGIDHDETPGQLSKCPIDESAIPPSDRIPRVTSAVWKYTSGAVGSLLHTISLHGVSYACELEVFCDGWMLRLVDPYAADGPPKVYVRSPTDHTERLVFQEVDDAYWSQMNVLVNAVRQRRAYKLEQRQLLTQHLYSLSTIAEPSQPINTPLSLSTESLNIPGSDTPLSANSEASSQSSLLPPVPVPNKIQSTEILCDWEDGSRSYELTWAIRRAAEQSRREHGGEVAISH
ncbi:putative oxidoreductase C terminal-domain-containing protein [Phlyctochytrium arcticum]|nr:putative oxidoreductase C terminal-domain-containing protein [Phlyctochytrium arcticum]